MFRSRSSAGLQAGGRLVELRAEGGGEPVAEVGVMVPEGVDLVEPLVRVDGAPQRGREGHYLLII